MPEQRLKIWCNVQLPDELATTLADALAPHELIWSSNSQKSNLSSVGPDMDARNADVIYGQPHAEDIIHSKSLNWVQLTTAGYTRYDNDTVRNALRSRGAIMTNTSAAFADPCAEHTLGLMLSGARLLAEMFVNSAGAHAWPYLETRAASRLLRGQSAVLVGFGAIGRRLVELLAPFEMKLAAVRRSPRGDEPVPTVAISQIDSAVKNADHVIDILPAATGTTNFFNASRFARMKRGAIFYNVGRGDTVDQDALCDALESDHLRAYLDVTSPEPLPREHRLWKCRNCWITPHTAGGHQEELRTNLEHFIENFRRFLRKDELRDRII
jgi:phosphoglycerate dehydrogenase-like enzyme